MAWFVGVLNTLLGLIALVTIMLLGAPLWFACIAAFAVAVLPAYSLRRWALGRTYLIRYLVGGLVLLALAMILGQFVGPVGLPAWSGMVLVLMIQAYRQYQNDEVSDPLAGTFRRKTVRKANRVLAAAAAETGVDGFARLAWDLGLDPEVARNRHPELARRGRRHFMLRRRFVRS